MADDKTPIISIDGKHLGKAAQLLVEKIAAAIGGLYRPRQIRLIAQAEAEAAVIEAKGKVEVADLQWRAMERWLAEEVRKQENIESWTAQISVDTHEPLCA